MHTIFAMIGDYKVGNRFLLDLSMPVDFLQFCFDVIPMRQVSRLGQERLDVQAGFLIYFPCGALPASLMCFPMTPQTNNRDMTVMGFDSNGEQIRTVDGYVGSCCVDSDALNIDHPLISID